MEQSLLEKLIVRSATEDIPVFYGKPFTGYKINI
jgi:hypothetical protein